MKTLKETLKGLNENEMELEIFWMCEKGELNETYFQNLVIKEMKEKVEYMKECGILEESMIFEYGKVVSEEDFIEEILLDDIEGVGYFIEEYSLDKFIEVVDNMKLFEPEEVM